MKKILAELGLKLQRHQKKRRSGFTLIELLVTMAIIGLMSGLLINNFNRTLATNRVSDDATLFSSKIEELRSLSGSTQSSQTLNGDATGYYAIDIPPSSTTTGYAVVRISRNLASGQCTPSTIDTGSGNFNSNCVVELVSLSSGVTMTSSSTTGDELIPFSVPDQQLVGLTKIGGVWQEGAANWSNPLFSLTYDGKTATVSVDTVTAQMSVVYK